MGRVLTYDDSHVTFAVSESLRGQTETRLSFGYSSIDDRALASASDEFLVLSQGDDYWGKPAPVVSLGQKVKGQASYLGWIAFPIKNIHSKLSVDLVRTMVDHKSTILSLERAKTLIQEIPYKGEQGASNKSLDASGGSWQFEFRNSNFEMSCSRRNVNSDVRCLLISQTCVLSLPLSFRCYSRG